MADETNIEGAMPTLEDWQHWTLVMGRAQQMLMEFWAESLKKDQAFPSWSPPAFGCGEADDRNAWRESAQGPVEHAARHRPGPADADQARRVRSRTEPGDHAGQGDQADAALPTDPVHADHGPGAEDAGRDLSAVDQPL